MAFVKQNIGYLLIFLICILFMFAEMNNDRFWLSDYEVYHRAAINMFHGSQIYNVYGTDPFYIYKYSPVAPVFFMCFAIFPLATAKIIYWIFMSGIIALGFRYSLKLFYPEQKKESDHSILAFYAAIPLALHFLRELHLGQVNYLIFFMYVMVIYFYSKGKIPIAAAILAISIFFKPFGLIFIPYFLWKKDLKMVIGFLCYAIFLFFVPLLFYHSWDAFIGTYKDWMHELIVEMGHKQDLFKAGNHTIFSVAARYLYLGSILNSPFRIFIFQLVLLVLLGGGLLFYFSKGNKNRTSVPYEGAILLCLIPLLAFTSENAFVFTGLAVVALVVHFREMNLIQKIITLLGFLFVGGNFGELLGNDLSVYIDSISLISIGTLIFIGILFSLRTGKITF